MIILCSFQYLGRRFGTSKIDINTPILIGLRRWFRHFMLQSNLDGSNTDDSFTMANSNSFLSPYEILPIAQGNKYLRTFSFLS